MVWTWFSLMFTVNVMNLIIEQFTGNDDTFPKIQKNPHLRNKVKTRVQLTLGVATATLISTKSL